MDTLNEGDRVGIMRTSRGELVFSVNDETKGIAAVGIVKPVWAVVSLYGKCTQVSIHTSEPTNDGCSNAAATAAAIAIATANYDIENFMPSFQEAISTTSASTLSSLICERRFDDYILSSKYLASEYNVNGRTICLTN